MAVEFSSPVSAAALGGPAGSGMPFILAQTGVDVSTAATTEGAGSLQFVNVPANAMGANGVLEVHVLLDSKSSTQAVNINLRIAAGSGGAAAGTAFVTTTQATNTTCWVKFRIWNANAANSQLGTATAGNSDATSGNAFPSGAIDTTAAWAVRVNTFVSAGNGTTDIVHVRGISAVIRPAA